MFLVLHGYANIKFMCFYVADLLQAYSRYALTLISWSSCLLVEIAHDLTSLCCMIKIEKK